MKSCRAIVLAALLGGCLIPSVACRAADLNIVFFSLDRAWNEFYKTKMAMAQLKQRADEYEKEGQDLIDEIEKQKAAYNKMREAAQDLALSEDVRNQKRDEAEEKIHEINEIQSRIRRFEESRQKELDDQSRRMRKRIVEEILESVRTYARTQGYSAVIDSSGQSISGVEAVMYTDSKLDITDKVLEVLNSGSADAEDLPDLGAAPATGKATTPASGKAVAPVSGKTQIPAE